ncbi:MAG TPA: DUF3857 domain-containing protein [Candidatus Omnitrophota bacterium]|nr:DUF3857 domain-containing protein [Candidatus Omnitrophota bacterium]
MRKIAAVALCVCACLSGCQQKDALEQARTAAAKSADYYAAAVRDYENVLRSGGDSASVRLELGKLLFDKGEYARAVEEFGKSALPEARTLQGISLFHLGRYTDALEVFKGGESQNADYRYYRGLTEEKLNLFDQALQQYALIRSGDYARLAREREQEIRKEHTPVQIRDIDPQVAAILAAAPPASRYPQAGALVLFADEKEEITADNKALTTMHFVIQILNERGKERFAEMPIEYDSTDEKVEVEYARTIKPDGTVVDVGSRHIRDVSKYLNFPLYSNARVLLISFPEIVEGATIEYKARIHHYQLVNKNDFVIPYTVQSSEPVIYQRFTLQTPRDRQVNIKKYNPDYNDFGANLQARVTEEPAARLYQWEFRDVPQIVPESKMPPVVEINPAFSVSSFKDWQSIYDWWWPLAREKIAADAAIKSKVRELTAAAATPLAKAQAVHAFCAQKIRYVAVEYGQAGYEPHQAADIFKNKYGDCKDQAILLVTMMREAGLTAWPVLIPTRDIFDLQPDFPSMMFNHAIAAVELDGKPVFVDPTAETCAFGDLPDGDQNRHVLVIKENGFAIETTPLFPPEHNQASVAVTIRMQPDETITGEKTVITKGIFDQSQRYWLLYSMPEEVQDTINSNLQDLSIGARASRYDALNLELLQKPVVLRYDFSGPEFLIASGAFRIAPQLAVLDKTLVAKDLRRYPIDFGFLEQRLIEYTIALPAGYKPFFLPEPVYEDSPWMKFTATCDHTGSRIRFKQTVEMKKDKVMRAEYAEFKRFFESLAKKNKQRIILERTRR